MPETPHPPTEKGNRARQPNLGYPEIDDRLLDAFLPDDEYEPHPDRGDFWIEKDQLSTDN